MSKRSRPDYTSLERPWEDFTHEELSMIASHLAGGGAFCCKQHDLTRSTVTKSIRRQQILEHQAYDRWGCQWDDKKYVDHVIEILGEKHVKERIAVQTAHYLEKFLSSI